MLLVGTERHLSDLDRGFAYVDDASVTSIAVAPRSRSGGQTGGTSSTIWALLDGARIVTLEDAVEVTHASVWADLGRADATCVAVVGDALLLVGFAGAHLALVGASDRPSTLTSFDRLPERASWVNPASTEPDLRSLATLDVGWFANVHVGGVWRSTDRGETWREVVQAVQDVHEIVCGPSGRLGVASARGFAWSDDGGESWEWRSEGLHGRYCRAVALDGKTVFLAASTGPASRDCRLYRAEVGATFEPCGGSLPSSFPFNIETGTVAAADGSVALGTPDGRVFRSADAGSTWELVQHGIWPITSVTFAE